MEKHLIDLPLEEKIKLLSGLKECHMQSQNLGGKVYTIQMADGPIGPHYPTPLLWLPSITCLSNTWNHEIVKQYVDALSDICIINGVDMLLGPAINIKKNPLCGRNFEYVSEDPFLVGSLTKTYIATLQGRGISPCLKHYCANNREYQRFECSSNMDERTLREIYTKAFEIAMQAKPWAVMCSYNKINGEWVSQHKHVLKDVLRDALGFDGLLVSDWGAVHERAPSLAASLDLEMPFPFWYDTYENVRQGLKNGIITEKDIDASVTRLEAIIDKIIATKKIRHVKFNEQERHEVAVKTCLEGATLLKNEDNILPLRNGQNIGVFGYHSFNPELGGGGSCNLADDPNHPFDKRFEIIQKPLSDSLQEVFKDSKVQSVLGYQCNVGFGMHYSMFGNISVTRITKESDVVVIVVGTNRVVECEGHDRVNLQLDQMQLDVIKQVTGLTHNVVVVIESGGVIDVTPFEKDVKAILYMPFGGEATNEALTKILTGEVCPSGKLTETFIKDVSVNPFIHEPDLHNEEYDDRIYVGYRLYETQNIKVTYPFGYGLSYTSFKYDNLKVKKLDGGFEVSYEITNTGKVIGKEISQVYFDGRKAFKDRPAKELVAFAKTELKPGETKVVKHQITNKDFAYFDELSNDWMVKEGQYKLFVGVSVKDIRLEQDIEVIK